MHSLDIMLQDFVVFFFSDRIAVGLSLSFLIVPFVLSAGIIFRVGFVIAERYVMNIEQLNKPSLHS